MERQPETLEDLLRRCTVRIVAGDSRGTGFFVAPGLIVTCEHVIAGVGLSSSVIEVFCDGQSYAARVLKSLPAPYPDLALLSIELKAHPCVYLHPSVAVRDELYSYGYTDEYPDGDSSLFIYEGPSESPRLLKLKDSQARPGLSGAPLLNRSTGGVCGLVKKSRDRNSSLGGRGIPTQTILSGLNELPPLQEEFHRGDFTWLSYLGGEQKRLSAGREGRGESIWGKTVSDISTLRESSNILLASGSVLSVRSEDWLDFSDLIERATRGFTGRDFIFQYIKNYVEGHGRAYIHIIADAGLGKTAIAGELVKRYRAPAYFLSASEGRTRPEHVLKAYPKIRGRPLSALDFVLEKQSHGRQDHP